MLAGCEKHDAAATARIVVEPRKGLDEQDAGARVSICAPISAADTTAVVIQTPRYAAL